MQSLELSPDHAAVLKIYLERTLADLSVEIAATDDLDFREHIKVERRLLAETLQQLTALHAESLAGDPSSATGTARSQGHAELASKP